MYSPNETTELHCPTETTGKTGRNRRPRWNYWKHFPQRLHLAPDGYLAKEENIFEKLLLSPNETNEITLPHWNNRKNWKEQATPLKWLKTLPPKAPPWPRWIFG
jgi:hypothetical protein